MANDPTSFDDARRRFALSLLQQGSDASPVRHPLAAVARALQGAAGGYLMGEGAREERDYYTRLANELPGLAPGGGQSAAIPARPNTNGTTQPPPSAPMIAGANGEPARAMVPSTPKVMGDQEAIDAGLYENPAPAVAGNIPMPQVRPASAPQLTPDQRQARILASPEPTAGTQPAAGQGARSAVSLPPEVGAFIQKGLRSANPNERALALATWQKWAAPTDKFSEVRDESGNVIGQRSSLTNEVKKYPDRPDAIEIAREMYASPQKYGFKGPDDPALHEAARQRLSGQSTSVAISNVAHPVLEGVGKQIVEQRKGAQAAAYTTIPFVHEARKALDEGAITGAFADQRLFAKKVGALFNLPDDKIANTEAFRSSIGNEVLAHIKQLGQNPSNADRDFIERVQGGNINLDEKSLRKILDMTEKYARLAIKNFNRDADKLITASPDQYRGIAPLMRFEEPPEYRPAGQGLREKYGLE